MKQKYSLWFSFIGAIFVLFGGLGQTIPGLLLILLSLFYPPFFKSYVKEIKTLEPQKQFLPMISFAFVIWAILATLIVAPININAWGTALGLFIVVFVAFFAGLVARKTNEELFWEFWVITSILATAYIFYDKYIRGARRASLLVGCNAAGTLLLIALSVFLATLYKKDKPKQRLFYAIFSLLAIYGILLTASRAAWVGLIALFVSLPLFGKKTRKLTVFILCACILLGVLIYSVPFWRLRFANMFVLEKNSARINSYKAAIDMMLHHPFGIGLSNFQESYRNYIPEGQTPLSHAHNIYLQFGAELGLIGMLFSIAIYISILYMCYKLAKKKPFYGPIGAGFFAVVIRELFDCTTLGLSVASFIWFFFGYICAEYILTFGEDTNSVK